MVLGLILGPLAESNFHRAMTISEGSYAIFLASPISIALFTIIIALLGWTFLGDHLKTLFGNNNRAG
jgi:putative tricarboxylic transport membrane protein